MTALALQRAAAQAIAAAFGASGIFMLWASFTLPWAGADAAVMLSFASALALAFG